MNNLAYSLRPLLADFLSTIVFVVLIWLTGNVLLATALGIATGVAQIAIAKLRRKPVPLLQWAVLGLVLSLGGATLLTNDPRFVMFKPTIIYVGVGLVMLQRGWMGRYIPPSGQGRVPQWGIDAAGYAWSALMFLTAAANLVFALYTDTKTWSLFVAIFPTASKLILFAITYVSLRTLALRAAAVEPTSEPAAPAAT